jgi:hypothetical protein
MIRRHISTAMLLALALAAGGVHADCVLPPPPSKVPDGISASEQEMMSAMQTLKEYDGDVNSYLKCLEFEGRQNRLRTDERESKHNAAVAQLEKIASKFNEQVRAFKAKHG